MNTFCDITVFYFRSYMCSLQYNWLYSMCKEVELDSPTSCPHSSYHISAFIRLDNALWFHSVAFETAVSTQKKNKRSAVFITSTPMPFVSERGSPVALYTNWGPLSNLLWWAWVCVVNPANDLWLRLSRSTEHARAPTKAGLGPRLG